MIKIANGFDVNYYTVGSHVELLYTNDSNYIFGIIVESNFRYIKIRTVELNKQEEYSSFIRTIIYEDISVKVKEINLLKQKDSYSSILNKIQLERNNINKEKKNNEFFNGKPDYYSNGVLDTLEKIELWLKEE